MSEADEMKARIAEKLPSSIAAGQIPREQLMAILAPVIDELVALRVEVRALNVEVI